jgi:tetratricopeptide (TPR) repeat protein/transcriptional regulator with XRE-family HTH domain
VDRVASNTATTNSLLLRERLNRKWSRVQLADQLGTTPITIARWEHGKTAPGPFSKTRLCELFGKSPEALGLVPSIGEFEPPPQARVSQKTLLDPALPLPFTNKDALVGRATLLEQLSRLVTAAVTKHIALVGMPGVGKTSLLAALVYDPLVQETYSEGILWVELGPEPAVLSHLARLGSLLGVDPKAVQTQQADNWALALRSVIGSRRILIVLDDVWSYEHALALEVGGDQTRYLLSTRFPDVASYFAGGDVLSVEELSEEEGLQLLAHLAPDAVRREPEHAQQLVKKVGSLPLALTLMGHYLRIQSATGQPRRLVTALKQLYSAEGRMRLSEPVAPVEQHTSLPVGTPLSLETAILVSERRLSEAAREALYALSLFPAKPNSFSEDMALQVSAASVEMLDALWDAGLLESNAPGRYSLHTTVADYARSHLRDLASQERFVACMRDFVQTHAADFVLLDRENASVLAAVHTAHEQQWHAAFISMVNVLCHFWEARGLGKLARSWLHQALLASKTLGDATMVAQTLLGSGRLAQRSGEYQVAADCYREGLEWAEQSEDSSLVADFYRNLGVIGDALGDYDQAEADFAQGLELARQTADQAHIPIFLNSLGIQALRRGQLDKAVAFFQEGLEIAIETENREQECFLLNDLGNISDSRKDYVQAQDLFRRAYLLAKELGHLELEAGTLANLGSVARKTGNFLEAEVDLVEALELANQIGHHWITINILLELGDLYYFQQRYDSAGQKYTSAIEILPEGNQELYAQALFGLAEVAAGQGDTVTAREEGAACLELYVALGHSKIGEVQDWLEKLPVMTEEDRATA